MKYSIKQAAEWLLENRSLKIPTGTIQFLCCSNQLKSEVIGRMRFIEEEELSKFEFRKPGRPKNEKRK